jgi:hypothetical protein
MVNPQQGRSSGGAEASFRAENRYTIVTFFLQPIEFVGSVALPPTADIRQCSWDVRKVPIADIRAMADIISYAVQFRDLRSHTPA